MKHKKLVITLAIIVGIIIVMFIIRGRNLSKKNKEPVTEEVTSAVETEVETTKKEPETKSYDSNLGNDKEETTDGRIEVDKNKIEKDTMPVQTDPTYIPYTKITSKGAVKSEDLNKDLLSNLKLSDVGTFWGSSLSTDDFKGGKHLNIGAGTECDNDVSWLVSNISNLNNNDFIEFSDLTVIGSLSPTHVALLCSSGDNYIVFEDITNRLNTSDFNEGDLFTTGIFKHNMKTQTINGVDILVVQYNIFE